MARGRAGSSSELSKREKMADKAINHPRCGGPGLSVLSRMATHRVI